MENEKNNDCSLFALLRCMNRKIDNLEELMKMLLIQNVIQNLPEEFSESAQKSPEPDDSAKEMAVYIQYQNEEIEIGELIVRAKAKFYQETGYPILIDDMRIYIKPEERAAYYVINNRYYGKVSFW